jgi:hypothetical protein
VEKGGKEQIGWLFSHSMDVVIALEIPMQLPKHSNGVRKTKCHPNTIELCDRAISTLANKLWHGSSGYFRLAIGIMCRANFVKFHLVEFMRHFCFMLRSLLWINGERKDQLLPTKTTG